MEISLGKPTGVYLGSLYFVLSGFLESIEKYREWGSVLLFNPLSEHSVWHLLAHTLVYLAVAYLLWQLTWLGRAAGLVFGYLTLVTYLSVFAMILTGSPVPSPLFPLIALFHVLSLVPLLMYLQPGRRKELFQVNLLEILLPND